MAQRGVSKRRVALVGLLLATALVGVLYQVRWRDGGRPRPFADTLRELQPADPIEPDFAVGTREMALVDESRTTRDTPGRSLPTMVYFPTEGDPGGELREGAAPAGGPFPLVVFAHGSELNVMNGATEEERRAQTASPAHYAPLLRTWAAAGYVVAAPEFPLTGRNAEGGVLRMDYVNQPADMSFVLDRLLEDATGGGWLDGHVDTEAIAATGHDLGATTAMGLVYNDCCADPRFSVAVPLGMSLRPFGDGRWFDGIDVPMLMMQTGAEDPDGTEEAFEEASSPKILVRLAQRAHLGPLRAFDDYPARLYAEGPIAFFDHYLKQDSTGLSRLARSLEKAQSWAHVESRPRNLSVHTTPAERTTARVIVTLFAMTAVALVAFGVSGLRRPARRTWIANGMIAMVLGAVTFQVVHSVEHLAQLGYWVIFPERSPWLTPWAMVAGSGFGTTSGQRVGFELLHLVGNGIYLAGAAGMVLLLRRAGTAGRARAGARASFVIQAVHVTEHVALVATMYAFDRLIGVSTLFGEISPGTRGAITYRVVWHFLFNVAATGFGLRAVRELRAAGLLGTREEVPTPPSRSGAMVPASP